MGDEDDTREDKALLRRVNKHLTRRRPRAEKKSSVQVASNSIRSFGKQRERKDDQCNVTGLRDLASDGMEIPVNMLPTDADIRENFTDSTSTSHLKKKGEYKEPWDYDHSYYPITLPLRQPYLGDTELLDEAEFGKAAAKLEYDEKSTTTASDLGLLEKVDEPQMLFLQLPPNLLFTKRPDCVSRRDTADHSKSSTMSETNQKVTAGNVPGFQGILLVRREKRLWGAQCIRGVHMVQEKDVVWRSCLGHTWAKCWCTRSGAVMLKLGDVL